MENGLIENGAEIGLEVVGERHPDAYGFTIRASGTGVLYRIVPARDPRQPRFWCVVVYRCSVGGLPDSRERPWLGSRGLKREDLATTLAEIRGDPAAWLAEVSHHELRDWMLDPGAEPAPRPATGR